MLVAVLFLCLLLFTTLFCVVDDFDAIMDGPDEACIMTYLAEFLKVCCCCCCCCVMIF
jgi:hypothetical protein